MRKFGILHISDLHIHPQSKNPLSNDDKYLDSIVKTVKEVSEKTPIKIMVISGDIVHKGGNKESYELALKKINYLLKELGIEKEDTIIVPGNHDISTRILEAESNKEKLYLHDKKYKDFEVFLGEFDEKYSDIYKVKEAVVYYKIYEEQELILIGLNSDYKIGINNELGWIETEQLKKGIQEIKDNVKGEYQDYIKIATMHHLPVEYKDIKLKEDEDAKGTFFRDNWKEVYGILLEAGINILLCGHVHGSDTKLESKCNAPNENMYYACVGSLGKDFDEQMMGLLKRCISEEDTDTNKTISKLVSQLEKKEISLSLTNHHNSFNILTYNEDGCIIQYEYKYFNDEGDGKWIRWQPKYLGDSIVKADNATNNAVSNNFVNNNSAYVSEEKKDEDYKKLYAQEIMKVIKENNLYKYGHFHRSSMIDDKVYRTTGWIDTYYLLNDHTTKVLIRNAIITIWKKEIEEADLVIGVGIKGTMLMTLVRSMYPQKEYTYFPDNMKIESYYESYFGKPKEYNKVIILTDVVHSGDTVKMIIKSANSRQIILKEANVICIVGTYNKRVDRDHVDGKKIRVNELVQIKMHECSEDCDMLDKELHEIYSF